jgi:hypothetical protein
MPRSVAYLRPILWPSWRFLGLTIAKTKTKQKRRPWASTLTLHQNTHRTAGDGAQPRGPCAGHLDHCAFALVPSGVAGLDWI